MESAGNVCFFEVWPQGHVRPMQVVGNLMIGCEANFCEEDCRCDGITQLGTNLIVPHAWMKIVRVTPFGFAVMSVHFMGHVCLAFLCFVFLFSFGCNLEG